MKKIMVIDDELDILDVLDRFLSRSGKYDVSTFSNPEVALQKAKSETYDLILSDIMMPQVSGMDILKEVKSHNNSTKVILMTAYSNKHKEEQSNEHGVDGYIYKPFQNLRVVEEAMNKVLN
ncbi:MAG: response regulator [Campylobacterota bacterium]|nr:response regulator [Campylobacterota bacterium]